MATGKNLGLVELLRRGCTDIWLISAAGDGADSFETLAQAFALAREELGVEFQIELEPLRARPEQEPPDCPGARSSGTSPPRRYEQPGARRRRLLRQGKAVATAPESYSRGTFSVPLPDGSGRLPGTITVVEATLIGDAPWDVHSYAERNEDFPDISTGYQLMDHRDFEGLPHARLYADASSPDRRSGVRDNRLAGTSRVSLSPNLKL